MSEKTLTKEETIKLINKLKMKHGADIDRVNKMIHKDITVFGYLSSTTQAAQKELFDKIEADKEIINDEN